MSTRFHKRRENYLERAIFGSELWADEGRETMTSELKEQTRHSKLCKFCSLTILVILVDLVNLVDLVILGIQWNWWIRTKRKRYIGWNELTFTQMCIWWQWPNKINLFHQCFLFRKGALLWENPMVANVEATALTEAKLTLSGGSWEQLWQLHCLLIRLGLASFHVICVPEQTSPTRTWIAEKDPFMDACKWGIGWNYLSD